MAAEMAEEPPPDVDGIIQKAWKRRMTEMVQMAFWHACESDGQHSQKIPGCGNRSIPHEWRAILRRHQYYPNRSESTVLCDIR